ncbi:hypothetical protein C1H46_008244 [Malus baccata]|uniref:Uncharacterized protein n=1 Tax=Malus baccata TaxID=106549 RepID=A0A540N579_MALBA|nr:hypothetical protein C1H46_008244 [Malus baccata]
MYFGNSYGCPSTLGASRKCQDFFERLPAREKHKLNLISNHRTASRVSQTPSSTGSVVATSPPDMGMTGGPLIMPISPTWFTAPTSSTSSVMHPILSARRTHRQPRSSEEAEQSGEASSIHGEGSQTSHSFGPVISALLNPIVKHHYKVTNLDANQNQYINDHCVGSFTQWKSDLHKHYEKFDGPEVALAVGCPIELKKKSEGKLNQSVKEETSSPLWRTTLIGRSKFPKIDMLKKVHENVHQGLGKARLQDPSASSSRSRTEEVESLTSEVADLKTQIATQQSQLEAQSSLMNQIRLALQISGIRFPDVEPPPGTTSQPLAVATTTFQPPKSAATPTARDCDVEDYLF